MSLERSEYDKNDMYDIVKIHHFSFHYFTWSLAIWLEEFHRKAILAQRGFIRGFAIANSLVVINFIYLDKT